MKRSQARELAMQLLFSMEARNDFSPECKDAFLEFYPPENQKNYVNSVYGAFADHMEEVDAAIEANYSLFGRGQMIVRMENGALCGGTEPRTDSNIACY